MFDRNLDTPLAMDILICLQLLQKKGIQKISRNVDEDIHDKHDKVTCLIMTSVMKELIMVIYYFTEDLLVSTFSANAALKR